MAGDNEFTVASGSELGFEPLHFFFAFVELVGGVVARHPEHGVEGKDGDLVGNVDSVVARRQKGIMYPLRRKQLLIPSHVLEPQLIHIWIVGSSLLLNSSLIVKLIIIIPDNRQYHGIRESFIQHTCVIF